jgi:hypothetical protein
LSEWVTLVVEVALVTVWVRGDEVLVKSKPAAPYVAVIECVPPWSALVEKLAFPALNAAVPNTVAPSLNVTVPAGVLPRVAETVAVNVTLTP